MAYHDRLLDLLAQAGWGIVYSVTSGYGRDRYRTYYIAPNQIGGYAVYTNEMIDELVREFGKDTTYIYKIEDVNNIWMISGDMLEITLPNK